MLAKLGADLQRDALYDQLRPLLRFTRESDGRLTGMPALVRLYPSPSLACLVDPLGLALGNEDEAPMPAEMMLARAEERLRPNIERLTRGHSTPRREDERGRGGAHPSGPGLAELERAGARDRGGEGPAGALGDGAGKWRLRVTAERPIRVMSLLASSDGALTNVSTAPGAGGCPQRPEAAPEKPGPGKPDTGRRGCSALSGGFGGIASLLASTGPTSSRGSPMGRSGPPPCR